VFVMGYGTNSCRGGSLLVFLSTYAYKNGDQSVLWSLKILSLNEAKR